MTDEGNKDSRSAAAEEALVHSMAASMRAKLAANRHKGGWQGDTPGALLERLREEVEELAASVAMRRPQPVLVAREAADVANFAAMVADVSGAYARSDLLTVPPAPIPTKPLPPMHEPEPWGCEEGGRDGEPGWSVYGLFRGHLKNQLAHGLDEHDAKRIVFCVNTLQGIAPEDLVASLKGKPLPPKMLPPICHWCGATPAEGAGPFREHLLGCAKSPVGALLGALKKLVALPPGSERRHAFAEAEAAIAQAEQVVAIDNDAPRTEGDPATGRSATRWRCW